MERLPLYSFFLEGGAKGGPDGELLKHDVAGSVTVTMTGHIRQGRLQP